MAIELHYLNTHGMMEQTCDELDGVVRLKERIAVLEKLNHVLCKRVTENDEIRLHWEEIEQTRAENERLNNALDKERSETIKYMDELCNAKNEIERLTIDKRNAELRADVADGTVEKLKADNERKKARIAELERMDTEHTLQIAKMNGYISHLEDVLEHHGIVLPKGHEFVMNNPPLPSAPKEDK